MTLGERIKARRLQFKMTQSEVADAAHISKQAVYKYENNIVTNIPFDRLDLLAAALQTTPAYLLGWDQRADSESRPESVDNLIISGFNQLSPEKKKLILAQIKAWKSLE